jgi:hypothetical protein
MIGIRPIDTKIERTSSDSLYRRNFTSWPGRIRQGSSDKISRATRIEDIAIACVPIPGHCTAIAPHARQHIDEVLDLKSESRSEARQERRKE